MSGVVTLVLVALLATDNPTTSHSAPSKTPAPADTFVTGSELILFGKEIDPIVRAGQSGYRVASDDSTVSINGIIYFNKNVPPPKRIKPINSKIERTADVIESAIKILNPNRNDQTGEITINGRTHEVGETFLLEVPDRNAQVSVTIDRNAFAVNYGGQRLICFRQATGDLPVNPVDATLGWVLRELHGPKLVIMGKGYAFTFPIGEAPAVRASLAKIPTQAAVLSVDEFGRNQYKPLAIDGYHWDSGVIRDIVENNRSSK